MLQDPCQWAPDLVRQAAAKEILERLVTACARERLVPVEFAEDHLLLGSNFEVPVERWYSMERLDLAALPEGFPGDRCDQLFEYFLLELFGSLPESKRRALFTEIQSSYLNMALSLEALSEHGCGEVGEGNLADWEGRVWCGHPLHPGARLRSGVSPEENREFGPEWQARLQLPLLSIPASSVHQTGKFCSRLEGLFPSLGSVREEGRVLIPVHPWQARHDLRPRFQERFESGELKFVERTIPARPTMSFRTVILSSESGQDYHLKLPVAVQTTGATRTVSVASTQNGPRMSEFLHRLMRLPIFRESRLFDHLHLMEEPASFYLRSESEDRSRFCAGILREGPGDVGGDRTRWVLPVAALLEPRENPLFCRAARYFGLSPESLFTGYCQRLLPPLAFLCGQMGVALEAHPQNMLVDFRGLPGTSPEIHFWYRDLGGIRMHAGRLKKAIRERGWDTSLEAPEFWPGSATVTDSERDLASKFVYSLLQNHLGELSRAISRVSTSEGDLWRAVDGVLSDHQKLLGQDLEARVFAEEWDLKAMWTMRLDSAVTEYTYQPVKNPLLQFRKAVCL